MTSQPPAANAEGRKTATAAAAKTSFRNKAGLCQQRLDLLLELLQNLRDFGEDLHDGVVRYLLDGEGESVLTELAGRTDAAAALGLSCSSECGHTSRWSSLLETVEPDDCDLCLRLGKVFEAASRAVPDSRFFCDFWFDGARWLEVLLQEGTRTHARTWSSEECRTAISGPQIERMLQADGRSPRAFLRAPFQSPKDWPGGKLREMVLRVADLGQTFAAHRELITPFLSTGTAERRLIAVENLARTDAPAEAFVEELVACATDSSKLLRQAAELLLRGARDAARPHLERLAREGDRTQREHAIRLLGRLDQGGARPFLEALEKAGKSAAVRAVIASVLNDLGTNGPSAAEASLTPPADEPIPLNAPVTPALREVLARLFAEYNEQAARHNAEYAAATARGERRHLYPWRELALLDSVDLDRICGLLQDGGDLYGAFAPTLREKQFLVGAPTGTCKEFVEHPDCRLIHVVRLLAMVGYVHPPNERSWGVEWTAGTYITAYRRAHAPPVTLRQVAQALRSLGLPNDILAHHMLESYLSSFEWEPESVWPYFADTLMTVERALEPVTGDWLSRYTRQREFISALRILSKFPQVPPTLTGRLWDLAIGTNKADRLRAQKVAEKLPDVQERLAQALASGSYQTRAAAAEWLGRLGDPRAVAPLDAAARKEKQDAALDEILTALERLGRPIEPYLDREKLERDAAKGLKKGIPAALEWFPWDGLPTVHWQDSGEEVPAEVIRWLLVQNYRLKSAEAGPLLRRYCAMIRPAEREALGGFVLSAWLGQDLKCKHTDAEARQLARQQAPQTWQAMQQQQAWYQQQGQTPPAYVQMSRQQVEEMLYQQLLRDCGSAVAEKGLLAVAGACCGESAVPPVQKYLKEWYGYRAAQCKALIAMLWAIDHPSAIQYLLSISNRFRTKGIREEAEKYVRLLAERKGWTLDELADRTMPTAGFDDDGTLEFSFGPRTFVARAGADLEIVLSDAEGKILKALPAPRKDDDADAARAAKKALSSAKSELKKFAAAQRTRLYEAMCTQRTWQADDWRRYLLGHPLMKSLCQRLVWAVCDGDRVLQTFRPLDDGTFTDAEDAEVSIAGDARLRIAHECQLPAAAAAAWTRHFADYDVPPLFAQFGRGGYRLPDGRSSETALDDFKGHMVEAFKLRGLATKLGYTRGAAQDGGWFYEYLKTFPGLELEVRLNFSGNGLPEENRTVALTELTFRRTAPDQDAMAYVHEGLPLGEVPAILLSECYNDLRSIAASGTGFDPDWEKTACA